MRSNIMALTAISSMLSSSIAFAGDPAPITKREARSLPASQVERRVMAQLGGILTEQRWDHKKPPVRQLSDMNFATKPRATVIRSLCRVDRLKVTFRPIEGGEGNADTPVVADGFSASHYFHFSEAPKSHFHDLVDYDRDLDTAACENVSFAKDNFFDAPSEEVATDGYFLAQKVIFTILEGKPAFPIQCDKAPVEKDRSCIDIIREIKTLPIDSIEECEADRPPGALCYRVYAGDRVLQVVASARAYGAKVLPPLTPLEVKVGELIVLSHERID